MVTSQLVEGYKYVYSTMIISVSPWISLAFEAVRQNARGGETEGLKKSNRYQCDVDGLGLEKNIFVALYVKVSKKESLNVVLNKDITMCV